jgi:hypothetical protein
MRQYNGPIKGIETRKAEAYFSGIQPSKRKARAIMKARKTHKQSAIINKNVF